MNRFVKKCFGGWQTGSLPSSFIMATNSFCVFFGEFGATNGGCKTKVDLCAFHVIRTCSSIGGMKMFGLVRRLFTCSNNWKSHSL